MTGEGSDTIAGNDFDLSPEDIIADSETVVGTLVSREGLAYEDGGNRRQVPGPVVVVATDRRVVFATEDGRDIDAGSLGYGEVASVESGDDEVAVVTTDGVRCELTHGPNGSPDGTVSHLRWVGELRNRLLACRNDVELAAGAIRDYASSRECEEAGEHYRELRTRLDGLVDDVQRTRPIPDAVLAPELTAMERTLERAGAQFRVARAETALRAARHLLDTDRFEQAGMALETAWSHADRARSHVASAERGDGFQFGRQRAIRSSLDRLFSDIEALAREFDHEDRAGVEARLYRVDGTLENARDHANAANEGTDDQDRSETGASDEPGASIEQDSPDLSGGPATDAVTDGSGLAEDG
ncbi:MAG: hypothetical protein ABEH61_03830 [Haloarculaceae archaeon]